MSVVESNQMGKGELNQQNPDQDATIDASIGLGGEDINWHNSPTLSQQQQDVDSSIFDGQGNPTTPYSTASRYINRRKISMHAFFYTQKDEYDASWYVGRKDDPSLSRDENEYEFSQSLAGFDTDNQNKGIPTMQIYLFGLRDWEQILRPNDYCAIRVWEAYPDDPAYINGNSADLEAHPEDTNGMRKRTLMVGLISDIQMNEDPNSSAKIYTVTCQGMQKVLADINLGLPKTAQWNDVNLLYDINGASSPYNETFPTYGSGSSSSSSGGSSSPSGPSKETGNSTEQGIIAWCNHLGYNVNQTAGVLASARIESQMGTANNGYNLLGISDNNVGVGNSLSPSKSNAYKYCEHFWKIDSRTSQYKSATSSYSAYKCGLWWGEHVEADTAHDDSERADIAETYAKEIK